MPNSPLLRMAGIGKSFPGVEALQAVDFDLYPGEVHALVGENGAGKSTLIKVLAGIHRPDTGTICLAGQPITNQSPRSIQDAGIRVIYQELNLVPGLSVAENLFLGRMPTRIGLPGIVNRPAMERLAREILDPFHLPIDPRTPVARLGIAHRQIVEIAKAVSCQAKIVVMDEPTAALTQLETEKLFDIIHDLIQQRVAIIYISHRLDEIERIADRVTVLRDGRHIITAQKKDLPAAQIIQHMVGRTLQEFYPKEELTTGEVLLEVDGLSQLGVCHDISFQLHRGEILGLAGLAGSGRTEIAELIFGRRAADRGTLTIGGQPVTIRNPRQAVQHGIGFIPEDRKSDGLVLGMSVLDNATLSILEQHSICGFLRRRQLAKKVQQVSSDLRLRAASVTMPAAQLSGGNQQKIVLAKWLLHDCQIYILDEPTRGVDVGAKSEIYRLMEDLAKRGAGIVMISSDLPEILNMSDRILVVHEGQITGELRRGEATEEAILQLAVVSERVMP